MSAEVGASARLVLKEAPRPPTSLEGRRGSVGEGLAIWARCLHGGRMLYFIGLILHLVYDRRCPPIRSVRLLLKYFFTSTLMGFRRTPFLREDALPSGGRTS